MTCSGATGKATEGCGESAAHGERSYASVKVLRTVKAPWAQS